MSHPNYVDCFEVMMISDEDVAVRQRENKLKQALAALRCWRVQCWWRGLLKEEVVGVWRPGKSYFTDNTLSVNQKIAVGHAFREAVLELKVYFCFIDEWMTKTEEISFEVEVLCGILMRFCLCRERSWTSTVRETILYYQSWVLLGFFLECVKQCMMPVCGINTLAGRGTCFKTLFHPVVQGCTETAWVQWALFTQSVSEFLKWWWSFGCSEMRDRLAVLVYMSRLWLWSCQRGEETVQISFVPASVWSLISALQFFFWFTVVVIADWDVF